jgi:DNA-binding XRE family transcriptional regulator
MLALVKTPRTKTPTELSISGPLTDAILADLRGGGYQVEFPFDQDGDEKSVDIRDTQWYQDMKKNPGNLLAGYRLREELTQKQLAEKSGIAQPVISAYERGKRIITRKAAVALGKVLNLAPDKLIVE